LPKKYLNFFFNKDINAQNYEEFKKAFATEVAMPAMRFIEEIYGIPKTLPRHVQQTRLLIEITNLGVEKSLANLIKNVSDLFKKEVEMFLRI